MTRRSLASPSSRGDGHRAALLPRDALIRLPYRLDGFHGPSGIETDCPPTLRAGVSGSVPPDGRRDRASWARVVTTDHYSPGQEARRRSRVTDASVVETVVVITVAQVSDGLSAGVAAVIDDTDDGYIKWTVFPVHEFVPMPRAGRIAPPR